MEWRGKPVWSGLVSQQPQHTRRNSDEIKNIARRQEGKSSQPGGRIGFFSRVATDTKAPSGTEKQFSGSQGAELRLCGYRRLV